MTFQRPSQVNLASAVESKINRLTCRHSLIACSLSERLTLALNMILVTTLADPTVKVIMAAKLATEHTESPDKETIGKRALKLGKS